jgi:hypothetical protein
MWRGWPITAAFLPTPTRTHTPPLVLPCIDYPNLPPSTITTVDTSHHNHVTLPSQTLPPSEQFWPALLRLLLRQTRVTLTVTTLTTSTPPSWRGFTLTGSATPVLSSDQVGSFAEATSSSHLNWAEYTHTRSNPEREQPTTTDLFDGITESASEVRKFEVCSSREYSTSNSRDETYIAQTLYQPRTRIPHVNTYNTLPRDR